MQGETKFKRRVLNDLAALEVFVIKIQQVSTCGDPDIVLCAAGNFVALELKTERGRTSPLQKYKLRKIQESGGISFVVVPSTWPEVLSFIVKLISKGVA